MSRGRDLARRRRLAGVSQTELAEMLGTHQSVISWIENNRPLNEHNKRIAREMLDLLPSLPEHEGEPPTVKQQAEVKRFIQCWAEAEPENAVRQAVAIEMIGKLRPGV